MLKVLFLCSGLSGYFKSGIECLYEQYETNILIIHYPTSEDAPFKLKFKNGIQTIEKNDLNFSYSDVAMNFDPDIVYVPGWADQEYLKLARYFKKKGVTVIAGLDNPWKGSIRQWLGVLVYRMYLQRHIEYLWVAGIEQYEFARRLGYPPQKIFTGIYTADHTKFLAKSLPMQERNNRILFVGRFYDWKGAEDLYKAFSALDPILKKGWKLTLVGNGPLKEKLSITPEIEIKEFLQPDELVLLMQQSKVFCLPSWKENWGVVIHEAVCAGCAVIVSDKVSSRTAFVQNEYNGFVFQSKNKASLQQSLVQIMSLSQIQMESFSKRSMGLSWQNTPERWAATIYSLSKIKTRKFN